MAQIDRKRNPLAPLRRRLDLVAGGAVGRRQRLARLRRPAWLGTVRRTSPLSEHWGRDRGTPVDRYYIERFLDDNRALVTGRVLEVMSSAYTDRFGSRVTRADVLDIDAGNDAATVVADLAAADAVATGTFDCFILTQTLQYVFDLAGAVGHIHRILRPGGTVLCTIPTVSRIGRKELDRELWRLTPEACRRAFAVAFPEGSVEVRGHGNVLTCIAFLTGMAAEELKPAELDADDPLCPLLVTVRATKTD